MLASVAVFGYSLMLFVGGFFLKDKCFKIVWVVSGFFGIATILSLWFGVAP